MIVFNRRSGHWPVSLYKNVQQLIEDLCAKFEDQFSEVPSQSTIEFLAVHSNQYLIDTWDFDMLCLCNNTTVLHCLAKLKDSSPLKLLLSKFETNINLRDAQGQSALQLACFHSRKTNCHLLLEAGININQLDYQGECALHSWASGKSADLSLLKLLIKFGADIYVENEHFETAMDLVINNPYKRKIVSSCQVILAP